MTMLVSANAFQKPPRFEQSSAAEERYYRAHEPRQLPRLFPLVSLAAAIGILAIGLNLLPV
jgi:hypothetical protein